jgi:nitrite reductase/ring-hydroxylating ferredoxin subunit
MPNSHVSGWHIIALASQVNQKAPFACKTPAQDYALFRDKKNIVRALEDRCIHRRAPLSLGRVTEQGLLQCPYHGWAYEGRQGLCKLIPNFSAGEHISASMQVKAFAVKESEGFIWLSDNVKTPVNKHAFKAVKLPALSLPSQGEQLLCIPLQGFWDALLDDPSLVAEIKGIGIVTGNMLGEPAKTNNGLTVEWSAAWRVTASKNKTPSDFPLILCVRLAAGSVSAMIELRDSNNQLLLSAVIAAVKADAYVTKVLWRWVSLPVSKVTGSKTATLKKAIDQLQFAIKAEIPAEKLMNTHRYVSAIWHQQLNVVNRECGVNA